MAQLTIVSLFDESGNALRPWAATGFACYAFDLLNDGRREAFASGGFIEYVQADLMPDDWREVGGTSTTINRIVAMHPWRVMGFPPCTDLAVSGSRHFAAKLARDPDCQRRAAMLARVVETVGEAAGCAWFAENPVSVLSSLWRKPNAIFHPFEYGGYLPADDVHPRWPDYIGPRDAYPKKTCLWTGGGYRMPPKRPVYVDEGYSTQFHMLGGKSAKTKQIRSETPRGFALAHYLSAWAWKQWGV